MRQGGDRDDGWRRIQVLIMIMKHFTMCLQCFHGNSGSYHDYDAFYNVPAVLPWKMEIVLASAKQGGLVIQLLTQDVA